MALPKGGDPPLLAHVRKSDCHACGSGSTGGRSATLLRDFWEDTLDGSVVDLRTSASRVSVTVEAYVDGMVQDVLYFSKDLLPSYVKDNLHEYVARKAGSKSRDGLSIALHRERNSRWPEERKPPPPHYDNLPEASTFTDADLTAAGWSWYQITVMRQHTRTAHDGPPITAKTVVQEALDALDAARQVEQNDKTPTTKKETTMNSTINSITAVASTTFTANQKAAAQAGYAEAGRIANNQASKLASKHLPMMLRGYADTAVGKLIIANIAALAAKQLRPNDPTLARLTDAMLIQAFQSVYQSVDIEGMLNSLLSSPEMQSAVAKLGEPEPASERTTFGSGLGSDRR